MKAGQNTGYKKEVFQTGLTERCRGIKALNSFFGNTQTHRERLNVVRKKKRK